VEYGIPHIASGEILRAEMAAGTDLGRRVKDVYDRGDLVSDDLMIELVRTRLEQPDTDAGFVLDGFPRTTVQAEALDSMFNEIGRSFSVVFALQIPDEVAFERLRRRAQIEGRPDDTDEAIRRRLDNYYRETAPLVEYYRTRGNLVPIHGDRSENEVFAEIQAALERVPSAERAVRESGPVEGVWGGAERLSAQRTSGGGPGEPGGSPGSNQEVPPARSSRS
jgi:adenylate kinase